MYSRDGYGVDEMLMRVGLLALVMIGTLVTQGCQTTNRTARSPEVQENQIQSSSSSKLATVRVYDGVVKFPAPVWADDSLTTLQLSKPFSDQKGPSYIFELIHKDDDFDGWKRLYSFSGNRRPDLARMNPDTYAMLVARSYLGSCPEYSRELIEPAWSENGSRTIVLLCGNTLQQAGRYGYGPDVGEVALMRFLKFENTMIVAQFAWRIPRFQVPSLATRSWLGVLDWLPNYEELTVMAERFKEISVADPQQIEEVPLKGKSQVSAL